MERDPELDRHRAQRAAQHQAACVDGLSDDRLRVVRARLLVEADKGDDVETTARLGVVDDEIERRRGRHR
ncbi:MAG TPA: hypothetical protein VGO78_29110 [Acidimicrobiales bacterium]|jgi:hypothetical protein|nr:hypothetical protein [Acidimicrobiales bacterium]